MAGEYTINGIYQGGYSTLDPEKYSSYGNLFTGYHVPAAALGAPTKPDTANQIQQVNMLMSQGIIPIEVGAIKPEIFDQIPKQHFKEINRMAKLTGSDISVHAPIVEASGIGEQGYDEGARKIAEQQLINVVERTAPMNDKGGMSITIHGAGAIPGVEYKMTPEGKTEEKIVVVNRDTGKLTTALQEEKKFYPSTKDWDKGTVLTPKDELERLNESEWHNSLSQLIHYKENADKIIADNEAKIMDLIPLMKQGRIKSMKDMNPQQAAAYNHIMNAQTYLEDAQQSISGLFHKAYKLGSDEDKKMLQDVAKEYKDNLKNAGPIVSAQSMAMQKMISQLQTVTPELYQPVEAYAVDKSADTFSNVALQAFKKHKGKAPTINIENMFPGMAFSYGKELNDLVTKSKEQFVKKAVEQGVLSEASARSQADKMIGVTLDVGHLNIARKKGFEKEDILKELNEIAKHVKHVHVTDNFGYSDSHLPPGMGNVPVKEIMERLEKEGKGDVKKVVEAGGWVQHFGTSPFPYMLEAMGSPMFADTVGTGQQPYWNQVQGLYQGYTGGFGMMLPQTNYAMFGAGFSQLPTELGGSAAGGKGSRMSGKPME
jgi:endonuclease IV